MGRCQIHDAKSGETLPYIRLDRKSFCWKNADLLVFDSDINIEQVYVSGVRMGQDS